MVKKLRIMNTRQHKIVHIEQKERNPISARPETSKSHLFDRLNTILGNYHEVFDAWNPAESRIFTYLKTVSNRLTKLLKINRKELLLLQLIPIDANQESELIGIRELEEHRDEQI